MTVQNGQKGNETNFNSSFISKTATSGNDVVGKINLQNSDSESIANVTNVQKVINENKRVVRLVQTVAASGQITIDERIKDHVVLVVGDTVAVNASTTPFNAENGGNFIDGTIVRLIGTNDTQHVTLTNNIAADGAVLNGEIRLYKFVCITLVRVTIGGTGYWLEQGRNN